MILNRFKLNKYRIVEEAREFITTKVKLDKIKYLDIQKIIHDFN